MGIQPPKCFHPARPVAGLVARGCQEIVLTGIHLGLSLIHI